MPSACSIRVRGVVQGVGFRPFVYRLAHANTLAGWVLNAEEGVEIHLEGATEGLEAFVTDLKRQPPPAARIAEIDVQPAPWRDSTISKSAKASATDSPRFASLPIFRSAMSASPNSSIPPTVDTGTPTSIAPIAGRATP